MKVEYRKLSIVIIPENDQDEVYLESVLGLKKKGDVATATRVATIGLDMEWDYVKIKSVQQIPEKEKKTSNTAAWVKIPEANLKVIEAENADLRTQLEGTYSKGYSLLQIENPTGRAYVFPYSPREDVFKTDTQKWSLVEVNGLKILIAASRITKQIAVGVVDATPM